MPNAVGKLLIKQVGDPLIPTTVVGFNTITLWSGIEPLIATENGPSWLIWVIPVTATYGFVR